MHRSLLRGGNSYGVPKSVLEIVDISDIHHPELLKSYLMDNPYGLGIKTIYFLSVTVRQD